MNMGLYRERERERGNQNCAELICIFERTYFSARALGGVAVAS
jgi:hypothetical protein